MKRIFHLLQRCVLFTAFTLLLQQANAQGCGCDFTLTPTDGIWQFDGASAGVQPGDTICLTGTRAAGIIFKKLNGTRQHPIVITNACGAKTIINHGGWSNVFTVDSSSFVHITGARSNPVDDYGIEIRGGVMAMQLWALTTDVEVDHVKFENTGCVAIVAKTDPTCNPATWRANFTMKNVKLHHNYVNGAGCEGFYVGNSHYDGYRTLPCNGSDLNIQEHRIDTVEIYNNILDKIGQDGIQVGGATMTSIHHNTITRWARNGIEQHANGIQVGSGTTMAVVYNNKLDSGGYCFADWGGGGKYFNNTGRNCFRGGFIMRDDPVAYAPAGYTVVNNTLVNYNGYGYDQYFTNPSYTNRIKNNIFAGRTTQTGYTIFRDGTSAFTDTSHNIKTTNPANVKFVDTGTGDYHLTSISPAINTGTNTSTYGVTVDFDGNSRPQGAAYDIGAAEYVPPVVPTVTSKFNFTFTSQFVNGGWISIGGSPHTTVLSGSDPVTGFAVSSISTGQWPPNNYTPPRSAFNGGTTVGTIRPPEVMVTHWFNYNAPYGSTVNSVVQGDNIALTGLAPNSSYTLYLGSSRRTVLAGNADEFGTMEYRFNGVNPQSHTVTNNTNTEVSVVVNSDATGRIGISARKISGNAMNYGYIGWLVVTGPANGGGSRIAAGNTPAERVPEVPASILVYPNPAGNTATLNLTAFGDQPVDVSIVSSIGELVQQRTIKGGRLHTFSTSSFANGVYFVRAKGKEKTLSTRLVINK